MFVLSLKRHALDLLLKKSHHRLFDWWQYAFTCQKLSFIEFKKEIDTNESSSFLNIRVFYYEENEMKIEMRAGNRIKRIFRETNPMPVIVLRFQIMWYFKRI